MSNLVGRSSELNYSADSLHNTSLAEGSSLAVGDINVDFY
jgi:hypothetical protein